MPIDCKHRTQSGSCKIASGMAGRDVVPWENVCESCVSCTVPRAINYVTASIAAHAWRRDGDHVRAATLHKRFLSAGLFLVGRAENDGVGGVLMRLISLCRLTPAKPCNCVALAQRMNRDGWYLTFRRVAEHSLAMVANWGRANTLAMRLTARCGAAALVVVACLLNACGVQR